MALVRSRRSRRHESRRCNPVTPPDIFREGTDTLARLLVLQVGFGVGPMTDFECLILCVEVGDVEGVCGSHPTTGVPRHCEECVSLRGVLVLAEVVKDLLCPLRFEDAVTDRFLVFDRGYEHLVVQALLDAVDGFEELHEHSQGRKLSLERDGLQVAVLLAPEPILME